MSLKGRRTLITGGGTGLGADLARGFSEAGSEVIIVGRNLQALNTTAARFKNVKALACDVTSEQSVKALFAESGHCDIVIANAGAASSAPFSKTTMQNWNNMLGVNLTGTFLTFREGLLQMTGWGRLVAISSIAGLQGYAYVAPYAAAKHGVVGLVRSLAAELEAAKRPVTVNALCPGYLETEMTERSIANIVAKTGRSVADARAVLAKHNKDGKLIPPAVVTAAALKLCSDETNGSAIEITGSS